MGFGHRVYKNGDPRAKHLQKMSRELGQNDGQHEAGMRCRQN
jgi:citrate synthase